MQKKHPAREERSVPSGRGRVVVLLGRLDQAGLDQVVEVDHASGAPHVAVVAVIAELGEEPVHIRVTLLELCLVVLADLTAAVRRHHDDGSPGLGQLDEVFVLEQLLEPGLLRMLGVAFDELAGDQDGSPDRGALQVDDQVRNLVCPDELCGLPERQRFLCWVLLGQDLAVLGHEFMVEAYDEVLSIANGRITHSFPPHVGSWTKQKNTKRAFCQALFANIGVFIASSSCGGAIFCYVAMRLLSCFVRGAFSRISASHCLDTFCFCRQ